jgi:CheY-like chemotaxis protein
MKSSLRVLFADDNPMDRIVLRQSLKALGVDRIAEASNGLEALELIRASQNVPTDRFDFIILDWWMPVLDGVDLLNALRKDPSYAHLKIIIVTSITEKHLVEKALASKPNAYLLKPIGLDALRSVLGLSPRPT